MHQTYLARVIIVLTILKLNLANKSEINIIPDNSTQKYCLIQDQLCGDDFHPLCKEPGKTFESQSAAHIEFLQLDANDKSNFLIEINKFRNNLAGGQIEGFKSGSNLRLVKWSLHFAKLSEATDRYNSFCKKISLNNSEFIEAEEFLDDNAIGPYFYKMAIKQKVDDSYGNTIWNPLFRAEFNKIGCSWVNDTSDSSYKLFCYTNRKGPEHEHFNLTSAYKLGKPCTACGSTAKCNVRFRNLCDDEAAEDSNEIDYNLMNYDDSGDEDANSHLWLYIVIGIAILVVAMVVGVIFLYKCLRDNIENSGGTYNIKLTRPIRGDIFSDT